MAQLAQDFLVEAAAGLERAGGRGRPKQVHLRRAISTAYYALFHALCATVADRFVGTVRAKRPQRAWLQAYRSLDHGKAKDRLQKLLDRQSGSPRHGFPQAAAHIAQSFIALQEERHRADYDPAASFTWAEALALLLKAQHAMSALSGLPNSHATALAVWLVFDRR